MMRLLCSGMLRSAARRWPAEQRVDLLQEWEAEVHAGQGPWQRLRFAASLATSRPHRSPVMVATSRSGLSLLGSFAVLIAAATYGWIALRWTTGFSVDTIAWQGWVGAISVVAAVGLGVTCARFTTGVTQLIRSTGLPIWVFGILYAAMIVSDIVLAYGPDQANLIDTSVSLVVALVCGLAVVRVTQAGRTWTALSRLVIGTLLACWMTLIHGPFLDVTNGMDYYFAREWMPTLAFVIGTRPLVHIMLFGFVYLYCLARLRRRHETARESTAPAGSY